jgi:hypothetical protein
MYTIYCTCKGQKDYIKVTKLLLFFQFCVCEFPYKIFSNNTRTCSTGMLTFQ